MPQGPLEFCGGVLADPVSGMLLCWYLGINGSLTAPANAGIGDDPASSGGSLV